MIKRGVSPKEQRLQRFRRPPAAPGAHMCVAEYINAQLHRGFHEAWPTKFCWEHTHVCGRTHEFKVAAKRQRLQRFGRPIAAVSTHVCVAECDSSKLHLRATGHEGLADQLLLRAHTCGLHPRVKGCKRLADQCCRLRQFRVAPMGQGLQGFGRPRAAARTHIVRTD